MCCGHAEHHSDCCGSRHQCDCHGGGGHHHSCCCDSYHSCCGEGGHHHGGHHGQGHRHGKDCDCGEPPVWSKEEKIAWLERYLGYLHQEVKSLEERLAALKEE